MMILCGYVKLKGKNQDFKPFGEIERMVFMFAYGVWN